MSDNASSAPYADLREKQALVTGAGRGIGRACAEALLNAGARVIAVARTQSDLDELSDRFGEQVDCWCLDVTSEEMLTRIAGLDALHILVNNVGVNRPQPFLEVEHDALDEMLGLNLRAAFVVAQAAARLMVPQGTGSIIHIGSQMGHVGAPNRSVYCMTKHGIVGLAKAMAVELAPTGVRVNAVAPTFIETPLTKPMLDNPEFRDSVLSQIPLGRLGGVEEVANSVLFLASDTSSLITGDSLRVDGGWTAR